MIEEVISKKELWAEFDKVFNPHDKNDQYVHVIITFWQESIENISVFDSLQLAERHIDFLPEGFERDIGCLLYTSPSPRDGLLSRMPSSA